MKKYLMIAAAGLLVAAPVYMSMQAQAEDAHVDVAVEAAVDSATDVAADVAVVEKTLADGTMVHIKGDHAFVVDAEGNETAAPDGVHTFNDGTTAETKDGMVVTHEADVDVEVEVEHDTAH